MLDRVSNRVLEYLNELVIHKEDRKMLVRIGCLFDQQELLLKKLNTIDFKLTIDIKKNNIFEFRATIKGPAVVIEQLEGMIIETNNLIGRISMNGYTQFVIDPELELWESFKSLKKYIRKQSPNLVEVVYKNIEEISYQINFSFRTS